MNPWVAQALASLEDFDVVDPLRDAVELARLRDRVDLLISCAARVITDGGLEEPYCSTIAFLRREALLPTGAAAAAFDAGLALEHLSESEAALERGEIGFAHFALIAAAREDLGHAFNESRLLKRARRSTVTEFRRAVLHAVHAAYPERFAEDERRGRESRQLKLSMQDDGSMFLNGWLEPEGASVVRSALEELAAPASETARLPRDRRLGDALVELAAQGVETELVVTVPVETLLAAQGAPAAETEWGGLLSADAVRRLACDAAVRRLVLDGAGNILDFGRRRRLFSSTGRRAMAARDGHCRFPHCDRPARWCEAHHRKPFAQGGTTALGGGVLLCRRHHHLVHDGGWRLVDDPELGGLVAIPPRSFALPPAGPPPGWADSPAAGKVPAIAT